MTEDDQFSFMVALAVMLLWLLPGLTVGLLIGHLLP